MAHEEDGGGRRDQSKFHRDLLFCENNGQPVLFPETRSLLSLRIGPITKIQNTKYIILIINFFL